ncbi:hypothetical protein ABEX29_06615 [Brevibacillus porteri]|uniref:hypothetical protein n=1 Tax=Brevibacillus porteri TaxID=2126350 RepID=UPI00037388BD|nr:hypothetical protein A616_27975 [Brevibacillus brevis X23]
MFQLPGTATIKDIIAALQEMEAINQKADLFSIVGAPATASDTVGQLIAKLVTAKSTIVADLTAKGIPASSGEGFQSLVNKLVSLNGKRWATGTFTILDDETVTVSGLSFKPNYVVVYKNNTANSFDINFFIGNAVDGDIFFHKTAKRSAGGYVSGSYINLYADPIKFYDNYFTVFIITNAANDGYRWLAFE